MPRCWCSFCTRRSTESVGTRASFSPCTIRPEDGQGARKLKSYMLAGKARLMKPCTSGRRIRSCMPIQAPNEKPATQQALLLRVVLLHPVERRGGVAQLALAVVEALLRAADAAEVEAQHREAAAHEDVEDVEHDLVVHRAAVQRVRMEDQGQRRIGPARMVVAPFQATVGAVEDHLRHGCIPPRIGCMGRDLCRAGGWAASSCRRAGRRTERDRIVG